ncbi:MAG: hypothetical protein ACK4XK_02185 [Casimicrobiaceae bacterium]
MSAALLPWVEAWLPQARAQVLSRHHAWLVVGRRGDGLAHAARGLAASILCEHPRGGRACGECASCRWLSAGAHPDLLHLTVEAGDEETFRLPTIKIDAARSAVEFASRSAGSERGRVILVDPADALSTESANALLKALEEPAADTRWLLVAERPARLLPTLRSRALRLVLPRPTEAQALDVLLRAGLTEAAARERLRLHLNAALAVLETSASDAELVEARTRFLAALAEPRELSALAWGQWVDAGGKLGRRQRFGAILAWLSLWLVERQRVLAGVVPRALPLETLRSAPAPRDPSALLRYHRGLLRAFALPDSTLAPRVQVERLLLDFRALFTP